VTIIGYIIALSTFSIAGRYVSLFLMACGGVGQSCSLLSTVPDTTDCHWKQGFAITLVWVSNAIPRPPA
jgi:hypothetical protein